MEQRVELQIALFLIPAKFCKAGREPGGRARRVPEDRETEDSL